MIQTGVRVSELTGLRVGDVHLGTGAHIRVTGKGRKKRATTLTGETVNVVRAWLNEHRGQPDEPLFPTRQGRPLSRYTVGVVVSKHAATAAAAGCPSLKTKQITPHTLRHTNAMLLRSKGVDIASNDRTVAWSFEYSDHSHLRARRPCSQGRGDRTNRPTRSETRQIPTPRHAPRLLGEPLIMLSSNPPDRDKSSAPGPSST
jgi:hypothetical protein